MTFNARQVADRVFHEQYGSSGGRTLYDYVVDALQAAYEQGALDAKNNEGLSTDSKVETITDFTVGRPRGASYGAWRGRR